MTGYVVIYVLGLSAGTYVLPSSPDFLARLVDQGQKTAAARKAVGRQPGKAVVVYCSWTIIWWTLFFLCQGFVSPPSRRLVSAHPPRFPCYIHIISEEGPGIITYPAAPLSARRLILPTVSGSPLITCPSSPPTVLSIKFSSPGLPSRTNLAPLVVVWMRHLTSR
jgi:hypothetical protein